MVIGGQNHGHCAFLGISAIRQAHADHQLPQICNFFSGVRTVLSRQVELSPCERSTVMGLVRLRTKSFHEYCCFSRQPICSEPHIAAMKIWPCPRTGSHPIFCPPDGG